MSARREFLEWLNLTLGLIVIGVLVVSAIALVVAIVKYLIL